MTAGFVIVATQRSGSTWLSASLDRHPQVVCHGEIFQRQHASSPSYDSFVAAHNGRRVLRAVAPWRTTGEFLDRLLDPLLDPPGPARTIGFKVMYNQLHRHPELLLEMRRRPMSVIHLVRHNVLKTRISAMVARERGIWAADRPVDQPAKVTVPLEGLLEDLKRRQWRIRVHRTLLRPVHPLEIAYEDLLRQPEVEFRRVTSYLAVPEDLAALGSKVKLLPDRLEDLVENYAELASRLQGTDLAWLLQ